MEQENNSKRNVGIVISTVIVLGILAVIIFSSKKAPLAVPTQEQTTPENSVPSATPTDNPKKSTSVYKDGTYTKTGSYMSPGGLDHFTVTLTLTNDIITDISVTPGPGDNTSAKYQAKFVSGYKAYVLGKNIDAVSVSKVSGSSLTSRGFNDALAQIRIAAKA